MADDATPKVLAGDIGATTSRLAIYAVDTDRLTVVRKQDFDSDEAAGLEEIVTDFLARGDESCVGACFGLPGPIAGQRVRTTNLPWVVEVEGLQNATGIEAIRLINDLEATAWGVLSIDDDQVRTLQAGSGDGSGNGAVIAAGTGLGEAGIFSDGRVTRPFASEGGHTSFSSTDPVSDGLLRFLRRRHETVSWERAVSGPGLAAIYRYLCEEAGQEPADWFLDAEASGDPAAAVSAAALESSDEIPVLALELFARLYGEEAGNLALKLKATGGVWVCGGIAPRILPVLEDGRFIAGFLSKGRMRPLLETMPVHVVLDDRIAVQGAARRAAIAAGALEQ